MHVVVYIDREGARKSKEKRKEGKEKKKKNKENGGKGGENYLRAMPRRVLTLRST